MFVLASGVYSTPGQPDQIIPLKVDQSGVLVSSSGNSVSTSYAEDTAHSSGAFGSLLLGVRTDADGATAQDGDYSTMQFDGEGRLKVSSKPSNYVPTVGNVTSAASTVVVNTERFSNLMMHCTGTFAGINCTFEGSLNSTNGVDGNWFAVQAVRTNANAIETTTGVLAAAPAYAWELSVNALKYFRVRATAWTSGTQVWTLVPGTYATEPIPAAQVSATQPVSGSVSVSNLPATQAVSGTVSVGNFPATQPVSGTVAISTMPAVSTTPATPSSFALNSAATTNATLVKASAGTLYNVACSNRHTAAVYVKLYDLNVAPTVGTSVPTLTITVPAGGHAGLEFGAIGQRFTSGISIAMTLDAADVAVSAVPVGNVKLLMSYI